MADSALQSLRRSLPRARDWWKIVVGGVLSALVTPLLVIVLGLIVHLLVHEGNATAPREWLLHWISGWAPWPWGGSALICLVRLSFIGFGLALVEAGALALLYHAVQSSALQVALTLKERLYRQAFQLGAGDVLGRHQAQVDQLFTTGVECVRRGLVDWWRAMPRATVSLLALGLLAMACDAWITLCCILFSLVAWRLYNTLRARARQRARQSDVHVQHQQQRLLEGLRQAPLVAGYALAQPPGEKVEVLLSRYQQHARKAAVSDVFTSPALLAFVLGGAAVLVFILGANVLTLPPRLSVAGVITLGTSLLCAYFPVARLLRLRKQLAQADDAAAEIADYLQREPAVTAVPGAVAAVTLAKELAFEGVTLADRQGQKLLDAVSFRIPARQKVAILASDARVPPAVGALCLRFLDPAAGRVTADGLDVRQADLPRLRKRFLEAAPSGSVFTSTVTENLACGDERFTAEQLARAIELVGASGFLNQLPQGLSTVVGEHALQTPPLAAFQLGLARAALRQPALLAITEPELEFSDSDDTLLDAAYTQLAEGRTLLVLPNRAATLRWADRILLFHAGQLVADGSHAELLLASELYRHLVYVRFNAFRNVVK